jgi:pimeloyl-ACP methyl ester carboxylesterase
MISHTVKTLQAEIAFWDTQTEGSAILLLHGNSSSKEIFRRQFDSPLSERHRLIAMDLPGHGASSDAYAPSDTYTTGGYARAVVCFLNALGIARTTVFGWSLGGHVALDMISRLAGLQGVMICGTPPIRTGGFAEGFRMTPHMALAGSGCWSAEEAESWARETAGSADLEDFMLTAARRAHGVARETLFADAQAGGVDDQRRIVETAPLPLAIVNGADDPFINPDYFSSIPYANLWGGRVHRLEGLGHAPFWEAPDVFNPLLERFAEDAGRQAPTSGEAPCAD